jgi:hypothetical protein
MPAAPRCPRCEYDLSGIVESWHDACPLSGVCPECGGRLEWGEAIRVWCAPAWSFEHSVALRPRLALLTLVRLGEPVSFWRSMRTAASRPSRVAMLLCAVSAVGLACALALSYWTVSSLAPNLPAPMSPWSLLADSYGAHSREAVIYLSVWVLGSCAGCSVFAVARRHFFRALWSAVLYAAVALSALWSLLAVTMIADVYQFAAFRVAYGTDEAVSLLAIASAWIWMLAMWYSLVRWRLPLRRPGAAWLASQAAASAGVLGFGVLDATLLPF